MFFPRLPLRPRQPLRGVGKISYLAGKALTTSKVEKYFRWAARDTELKWERNRERIVRDAASTPPASEALTGAG